MRTHVLLAAVRVAAAVVAGGVDWPQFHGPGGSGLAADGKAPVVWSAELFVPVAELFGWVYRAAHELSNHDGLSGSGVRGRWDAVVRGMARVASRRANLADSLRHFV